MECVFCVGTGAAPGRVDDDCPVCDGTGKIADWWQGRPPCPRCVGTGRKIHAGIGIGRQRCGVCKGHGRLPPEEPTEPTVWHVEAGGPYTTRQKLDDLFATLTGDVCACDPYYGTRTLASLAAFTSCSSLRFLTKYPDSKEQSFLPTSLKDFRNEHPQVEIHECSDKDIHDRYVLTDSELIIVGHGLKDIGTKESFVIVLKEDISGDLITTLKDSFEGRWKNSTPLP